MLGESSIASTAASTENHNDSSDGMIHENCGDEEESNCSLSPTLFKLSGVDTSLGDAALEDGLSEILSVRATLLETDSSEGTILFCCCHNEEEEACHPKDLDAQILTAIQAHLQKLETFGNDSQPGLFRCGVAASISIVDEDDEECVEYITEEEAYRLWLEQTQCDAEDENSNPTDLVSSPDGDLVRPKHQISNEEEKKSEGPFSAETNPRPSATTAKQLERDPGLFDYDNVERIHYQLVLEFLSGKETDASGNSHSSSSSSSSSSNSGWKQDFGSQPIILYGLPGDAAVELQEFETALRDAICQQGSETIVRTGNRETLVASGFHNSKPATLSQVVDPGLLDCTVDENGAVANHNNNNNNNNNSQRTIVFNPIREMPLLFRSESVLGRWLPKPKEKQNRFPNSMWRALLANGNENDNEESLASPKFTLCIASEGFGIGMHKHGPALFFLTEGRKKWYLSHPGPIDEKIAQQEKSSSSSSTTSATHPGFYRDLSTHKCIQEPGELLLVPNLWYHEIYNLASPTIGIQALADELPIPGTLSLARKFPIEY